MNTPPAAPEPRPHLAAQPPASPAVHAQRSRLSDVLLVILFLAFLLLPIVTNLLGLQSAAMHEENRTLAQLPAWPVTRAGFLALPDHLSAFANDRFGLRNAMLWLDGYLRYHIFGEAASDQILFGRHHRVFLGSQFKGRPLSLIDNICGVQSVPSQINRVADGMASLLDQAGRLVPHSLYVSIPTAPALYPEDLPRWLAALCSSAQLTVPQVKAALEAKRPDLASRMIYPIETMQALKAVGEPIPRANFHWQDLGAKAVAEVVAERWLGLPKMHDVPLRMITERSDLSQFLPGLDLRSTVGDPDYAKSGVVPCYGVSCAPELEPFAAVLTEITRFQWPEGNGPRLLLISNSFGVRAARYLSEYFANVMHVNLRYDMLTSEQGERLRLKFFEIVKPDTVILLFNDNFISNTKTLNTKLFGSHTIVQ